MLIALIIGYFIRRKKLAAVKIKGKNISSGIFY